MEMDEASLKKLKVSELKNLLEEKGFSTTGKKDELINRLLSKEVEVESKKKGKEESLETNKILNSPKKDKQQNFDKKVVNVTNSAGTPTGSKTDEVKNEIKQDEPNKPFNEMTEKEKRIARAKRFGLPVEEHKQEKSVLKKEKQSPVSNNNKISKTAAKLGEDPDLLRKRAERFGNLQTEAATEKTTEETDAANRKKARV